MFMVPTTLFRVPHALLMVPPTLTFFKVPTPNHHASTNFFQGSIYMNVHDSTNIIDVPR